MTILSSKYTLEPYQLAQANRRKQKHTCPACGKRTFVRYIDVETNQYIGEDVGRCDREVNCGYHKKPNGQIIKPKYMETKNKDILYIDREQMKATLKKYDTNNLFIALCSLMDADFGDILNSLIKYNVGTTKNGSAIFWQVDLLGNVRTGKILQYDTNNCKRVKDTINWIHTYIQYDREEYDIAQCIFGEHLIANKVKNIVVVEAEKTAVICDIYFNNPDYIFVSCGGKSNLNESKLNYLKTFCDCLYVLPDADAVIDWFKKSKTISGCSLIDISQYLTEQEIQDGYDVADMILNKHSNLKYVEILFKKNLNNKQLNAETPHQSSDVEEYDLIITLDGEEYRYPTTMQDGVVLLQFANNEPIACLHIPTDEYANLKKYELKKKS